MKWGIETQKYSSLEAIITCHNRLEALLEAKGAVGIGLHEKALSIETTLGKETIEALKTVATIRNKAVYESGFAPSESDKNEVVRIYKSLRRELDASDMGSIERFKREVEARNARQRRGLVGIFTGMFGFFRVAFDEPRGRSLFDDDIRIGTNETTDPMYSWRADNIFYSS